MRFKKVYLLSIAVLMLCVSPSLGKKPEGKGKPKPPENYLVAGFECESSDPQPVCTTYDGAALDEFERVALYSFAASYASTGSIDLYSDLGDPFPEFVRNDPDNICGLLGNEFEGGTVIPGKFTFGGNSNTYEASVGWKFFDLSLYHPDLAGFVDLPKVSFFYRDEAFVGSDQEDDPFVGEVKTIENWAVLARVEGYVPVGKKRGKTIQCFWLVDDPADGIEEPVVFTVDGR